eukprot:CAMPEP_0174819162 /NCGR_PEP_ID=MMETSP1107-20130205/2231_1 /TAXON_ID=36770 /ORGANISM="Paraphysomonas vestita, Strain GFlagA" /LENGTH=60 /DNA_ID=CAMNT_0016032149 /DNA_START=840 /DNA_END=1022 /DNA_ORIENTATION=-
MKFYNFLIPKLNQIHFFEFHLIQIYKPQLNSTSSITLLVDFLIEKMLYFDDHEVMEEDLE